jgi:hypothetical protein
MHISEPKMPLNYNVQNASSKTYLDLNGSYCHDGTHLGLGLKGLRPDKDLKFAQFA